MLEPNRPLSRYRSERGTALLLVLGILAIVTLAAVSFTRSTATRIQISRTAVALIKAENLADAGVYRAILELIALTAKGEAKRKPEAELFSLGDGEVTLELQDEAGLIDVNAAPLTLIAGLLRVCGVDSQLAARLADQIGDFRDLDAIPRPYGAEDPDYLVNNRYQGSLDGPLRDESELLHVLGMTNDVFECLRPFVTVFTGSDAVDPMSAPRQVLNAVPGLLPSMIDDIIENQHDPLHGNINISGNIRLYLRPSFGLTWRIKSQSLIKTGGIFTREAVISLGGSRPFTILAWRSINS